MEYRIRVDAAQAWRKSGNMARAMCHPFISTEHVLLALWMADCQASNILKHLGVGDEIQLVGRIAERHPRGPYSRYGMAWDQDHMAKEAFLLAAEAAQSWGDGAIHTQHLLAGIAMRYQQGGFPCVALEVLHSYSIAPDKLVEHIRNPDA